MPSRARAVLDTNVVFSAILKKDGSCSQAVRAILSDEGRFELFYTPAIKEEYLDVLFRPKLTARISSRTIEMALAAILDCGTELMSRPIDWIVYPGEDDKPFVEAAIYADAILLTNNRKDYPFVGLKVMYPEEFLAAFL